MNDLISRQAAIDAIESHIRTAQEPYVLQRADEIMNYAFEVSTSCICNLPSAEPRWIPVEDEPPKEKKHYWVCTDTGYQCECRWTNNVYGLRDSDEWGWSIFDIPQYTKVVAYMPLPEPWKGEYDV